MTTVHVVIKNVVPTPSSLILTSSGTSDIVTIGDEVTLTCTLVFNSAIVVSDLSLLMVDVQLFRDEILLSNPIVSPLTGTTFTYTTQLNSFGRSDSGNYTCNATIGPQPTSTYLTGTETLQSSKIRITTGEIITEIMFSRQFLSNVHDDF